MWRILYWKLLIQRRAEYLPNCLIKINVLACEIKSVGNHMESFSRNPDIAKNIDGDIILAADLA